MSNPNIKVVASGASPGVKFKKIIKSDSSKEAGQEDRAERIRESASSLRAPDFGEGTSGTIHCVLLGRYGDILHAWPLLWRYVVEDKNPILYVAKEFENVSTWARWLQVVPLDLHYSEVKKAVEHVRAKMQPGDGLVVMQVYNNPWIKERLTSYCEEMYLMAGVRRHREFVCGFYDTIGEFTLSAPPAELKPLLEEELSPVVLVNSSGVSSPLNVNLVEWAKTALPEYRVVDLSQLRLPRLIDLIWLYRRPQTLLITNDTATLHLCGAAPIPYVAILSTGEEGWGASIPRNNCIAAFPATELTSWLPWVERAVRNWLLPRRVAVVTSNYTPNSIEAGWRLRLARMAQRWFAAQAPAKLISVHPPRMFEDDQRTLPYVRDLIDRGFASESISWVFLVNDDIIPGLEALPHFHSAFVRPRPVAFDRISGEFTRLQLTYSSGRADGGCDGFLLPRAWWDKYREMFPDMVLGASDWDVVMRRLICLTGGEVVIGGIFHKSHSGVWQEGNNRYSLRSNIYNRRLADKAYREFGAKLPAK